MKTASRLEPLARAVLRTQSDERLVSLTREGREQAFEEIVRRYRAGLVAFAAAYGARESAEDVVQECLERSWGALRRSESEIQLKPWLYAIVRNRALNARRDARAHALLDEEIDGVRRPDEIVLDREEFDRMVAAIKALPDAQRRALLQSAFAGHTHEQIATSLGSNSNAVAQLIWRARTAVRHGVGLVIPLPVLRAILDSGPEAVAGVGAGGGAAMAATGGAPLLAKGATVALIGVVAAGSGVAIKKANGPDPQPSRAAAIPAERAKQADRGQAPGSSRPGRIDAHTATGGQVEPGHDGHGTAGADGPGEDGGHDSSSSGPGSGGGGSAGGRGPSGSGSGSSGSAGGSGSSSSGGSGGSGTSGSGSGGSHGSDHDDDGRAELDDSSGSGDEDGFEETESELEHGSSGHDSAELEHLESESSEDSGSDESSASGSRSGDDD